ncbi:MAG: hypothetical protein PVS2B2_16420 [Candidatus Acidiferrum sp.]
MRGKAIMAIKVLLADDTEIARRAIRRLLDTEPEIDLIGEAVDFAQAIQMAKELRPEVVVMDLYMPNESKVTLEDIRSHLSASSRVLAISVWIDDDAKSLAQSLGAFALLDKMELSDKLIPTIRQLISMESGTAAG